MQLSLADRGGQGHTLQGLTGIEWGLRLKEIDLTGERPLRIVVMGQGGKQVVARAGNGFPPVGKAERKGRSGVAVAAAVKLLAVLVRGEELVRSLVTPVLSCEKRSFPDGRNARHRTCPQ